MDRKNSYVPQPGDVIRLAVKGVLSQTEDGFAMGSHTRSNDELVLHENVSLELFPSFRDFSGKKVIVKHGQLATILRYVGRTWKINRDPAWFRYDLYEIMTCDGDVCQVFRHNIRKLK